MKVYIIWSLLLEIQTQLGFWQLERVRVLLGPCIGSLLIEADLVNAFKWLKNQLHPWETQPLFSMRYGFSLSEKGEKRRYGFSFPQLCFSPFHSKRGMGKLISWGASIEQSLHSSLFTVFSKIPKLLESSPKGGVIRQGRRGIISTHIRGRIYVNFIDVKEGRLPDCFLIFFFDKLCNIYVMGCQILSMSICYILVDNSNIFGVFQWITCSEVGKHIFILLFGYVVFMN